MIKFNIKKTKNVNIQSTGTALETAETVPTAVQIDRDTGKNAGKGNDISGRSFRNTQDVDSQNGRRKLYPAVCKFVKSVRDTAAILAI